MSCISLDLRGLETPIFILYSLETPIFILYSCLYLIFIQADGYTSLAQGKLAASPSRTHQCCIGVVLGVSSRAAEVIAFPQDLTVLCLKRPEPVAGKMKGRGHSQPLLHAYSFDF